MLHGRWTEQNRIALEELIGRDHAKSPIAVFDWDNTCVRGDVADAVFHRQCDELAFQFEAPGFWDWVTEATHEVQINSAYVRYSANPSQENRLRLRMSFERTRDALHQGKDDTSAWAWDTGAFVGWTEEQARAYTRGVIRRGLAEAGETETIELDGDRLEIGVGLRIRPEMKELMQSLGNAGWRVWVLSASPQWEIEAFAEMYDVPRERVIGMRRELAGEEITYEVAPPVSYSDGKLDAYQAFISRGEWPSFVAGDSLGDWKLLESAQVMRLLIEPAPDPLRRFALWRQTEGEAWLLQEFD